ncbi:MAG: extracellular solute-binding protein [Rhodospirillaceae bacterium]|nr:extracellular solute-binding protein [Rhodospirillaceae bacterium]
MGLSQFMRGAAAAVVAAVCFGAAAPAQDKQLNLYIWSDYLAPDTLANFTRETGIAVNVDNFDSSEMLEAKMLAGGSGYDIIVPNGPVLARLIKARLVRPLDRATLSNLGTQDPAIAARAAVADPGNAHAVVYMWGTSGLGYNTAKVAERLGEDAPTDSWALLFDPANAGKLADCGIYAPDSPADVFEPALAYLGKDPHTQADADYHAAASAWTAVRPHIAKFHNSEYVAALANGDICLAMGYSGDIFQAADRAAEAGAGVEIAYTIPKEGAFIWFDFLAIPTDTPNAAAAHAFIDYILRPDVIGPITNHVYYANPNLRANDRAASFVSAEILDDPAVYPTSEVVARLFTEQTPTPALERLRTRLWTRIKTGQ